MRILMLAHTVAWQGSSLRALSLARPLARRGHTVTVVAARIECGLRRTVETVDGVRLVQFPDVAPARLQNGGPSPFDLVARDGHVLRFDTDVVHSFEPRPVATLPALVLRRRKSIPYVADWADLWGRGGIAATWPALEQRTLGAFDELFQRRTRQAADAVTAISSDLAARAAALGVPASRVRVVASGANDDTFRPGDARSARAQLGLPSDALVVAHTGFAPFDDHLLAAAWTRIAAAEPRARLVTTGRQIDLVATASATAGVSDRLH